jgi:ribosomal protein S18 acetylase RimI-like enzyme
MPYQLRGHADLTPYDTGPEAVERHGYDPAEVAASMLLLHNRSHPLRGDMEQRDVDRLTGIVQKRHQMQRDYENRTAARPNPRLRLEVEHHDDEYGGKTVSAHDGDGDRPIAYLRTSLNPDGLEYIDMIHVDDRYKRLGVGRTIWEHAGRPMHAPEDQRSWEGLAWSKAVGGDSVDRTAARLAMPAPMPEGVTFHYHPTNATIPTEPWVADPNLQVGLFSAPAVEARHDGRHIGHLGWDSDPDDEGDPTPVVSMIKVHPDYRRHGIGTALWDFARRHEPDLQHSDIRTELGELWVNHERDRLARLAMAWDQWAPRIEGGCANGCDHSRGMMGEYSIGHPDGSGPKPGDLMPGLKGRSVLHFTHDTGSDGTPELYVSGVHTDENHRRDGVAEALMRRLHQDHPGTRINPGFMTDMGEGLKDGLVNRIPGAQDVLAGDQRKAALDLRFFLGLDWHSHDDDQQRIQLKDKIPADPSWLEPTDADWYHPVDENGEAYEDFNDELRAYDDPSYDPAPRAYHYQNPPRQQTWYHVSPHEMKPGDTLVPLKNESYDNNRNYTKYTPPGGGQFYDDEFENPLKLPPYDNHTQRNYVWMAPKLTPHESEYEDMRDRVRFAPGMTSGEEENQRRSLFWQGDPTHASWWANRLKVPHLNNGRMHIYEVRPTEHPKPWNGTANNGWAASGARVVRKVDPGEWFTPHPNLGRARIENWRRAQEQGIPYRRVL